MTTSVLELQRARNQLATFCRRRNRLSRGVREWRVSEDGGEFVIAEVDTRNAHSSPLLRLHFENGRWLLAVPAAGGWQPYPPRPEVAGIEAVIDELEQAPLHVHWGKTGVSG
ncbi:MAG: DUF3024 domain-containing protein [Thiogranum sp.]|jgi:hypothetical protein|nr:DUF3024 domain-containing protein [Thiogranum sp.]